MSAPVPSSGWPRSDLVILGVVAISGIASVVSRMSEDYLGITSAAWTVTGMGGLYVLLQMEFHWVKLLIASFSLALAIASLLSVWMR